METILNYIKQTYAPSGILVYGSYANGTNSETSDFDALVVTERATAARDNHTVVDGVRMDLFFYTPEALEGDIDLSELARIVDGTIVLDTNGALARLTARVAAHIEALPPKTDEEKAVGIAWCEKMLARASRRDAEGLYRHHWLLTDSLEIVCDIVGWRYLGPKKMLARLEAEDAEGARLYQAALASMEHAALADWVGHIKKIWEKSGRS